MSESTYPNILFVIWDACRADYAANHAVTLDRLAHDNISFENAVAASNWSLPSHASLFSGSYPSEHNSQSFNDRVNSRPLLDALDESYRTYSVSANGFASNRTGFHEPFDQTHYTRGSEVFQGGLDVYDYGRTVAKDGAAFGLELLRAALEHKHPIKSLCNLGSVAIAKAAVKLEALQHVPHPLFAGTSGYMYTGAKNNHHIRKVLEAEAGTDSPFFLFSNFMDTHRPYMDNGDAAESFSELYRLNENIGAPWRFLEKLATDEIDPSDIQRIRELYEKEVEAVDEYLKEILHTLDALGLRENTLIVVSADHGENLGEEDDTGRVRMGHMASMSDALLKVPLVVAHPELDPQTITEPVSLNGLYDLFVRAGEVLAGETDIETVLSCEEPVFSECPATGTTQVFDRYPDVPEKIVRESVVEHGVAGYNGKWRIHTYSTGEAHAWHDGARIDIDAAPGWLVKECELRLAALAADGEEELELSDDEMGQLEALGYL